MSGFRGQDLNRRRHIHPRCTTNIPLRRAARRSVSSPVQRIFEIYFVVSQCFNVKSCKFNNC
jgi:hypothetical protein